MEKFYNPVKIYHGSQCLSGFKEVLEQVAVNKILLLTYNEEVINHPSLKELISYVGDITIIHKVMKVSNPDIQDLYQLYMDTYKEGIDLVVGVGGGSVLDVAKSLCCLYAHVDQDIEIIRQKMKNKEYIVPHCPWIGLPTTSGTGSEVTCWATIWDNEKGTKLSLESINNYAYAVFVDAKLTTSMHIQLIVSSGLDAIAHATEAYWSKHTNTISRIYALKAIQTIFPHLEKIINNDMSEENFEALSKGSMLAGLAFSNTKTTACHSISYPLTLQYQIPHGVAVSLLLAPVMFLNYECIEDAQLLLDAYGVNSVEEVTIKINYLLSKVKIPVHLSDWKVKKEDLEGITKNCFTAGRMDNNPRDLNEKDVYHLLERIL